MIKLALNKKKLYNYSFFCPVSRLHLTVSNPTGLVGGITPAILKGLRFGTLIDVNNVIDIKTGTIKTDNNVNKNISTTNNKENTNKSDNKDTKNDGGISEEKLSQELKTSSDNDDTGNQKIEETKTKKTKKSQTAEK